MGQKIFVDFAINNKKKNKEQQICRLSAVL